MPMGQNINLINTVPMTQLLQSQPNFPQIQILPQWVCKFLKISLKLIKTQVINFLNYLFFKYYFYFYRKTLSFKT